MANRFFKPVHYPLMYKDNSIGRLTVDCDKDGKYTYSVSLKSDINPIIVPRAFKDKTGKFISKEVSKTTHNKIIKNWLEERVFPPERHDAPDVLDSLGLTEYDPISILKRTKGRIRYDNYWLNIDNSVRNNDRKAF